jgi:16S rRNA processing protein RimM
LKSSNSPPDGGRPKPDGESVKGVAADADYLAVALIMRPQGRHGEVSAEILTDFPERFAELRRACLEAPDGMPQEVVIESAWPHKGRMILKFSGVNSIHAAEELRGRHLLIHKEERVRLTEGHYYFWELEGCRVLRRAADGTEEVGRVTSVEATPGVALLHVSTSKGEVLIPFAQAICTRIDSAAKTIWIEPPGDLLELNS